MQTALGVLSPLGDCIMVWNKGLKAMEDERIKRFSDAGHNERRGKPSWNKGIPMYDESKRKLSMWLKTNMTDAQRKGLDRTGCVPWNKGIEGVCKANSGSFTKGCPKPKNAYEWKRSEYNPNWKGGVTGELRLARNCKAYKEWCKKVFERDNYTCQICGDGCEKGRGKHITLNAHHINSFAKYPELRYDISNGITLCYPCHIPNGTRRTIASW